MRLIDQQFLLAPFYGSRRMTACLERSGETANRKRVQRLMAKMGLEALFPRPRTTTAAPDARVYPYLLRDRVLTHVDEAWSSDITYVPMRHGFMYLTAVIDWFSRYVLSWSAFGGSNTLEGQFCLEALDEALSISRPESFNTDQGSQFTAREYTDRLEEAGIAVSRDSRGRALETRGVVRSVSLLRGISSQVILVMSGQSRMMYQCLALEPEGAIFCQRSMPQGTNSSPHDTLPASHTYPSIAIWQKSSIQGNTGNEEKSNQLLFCRESVPRWHIISAPQLALRSSN
jgi:transposase InsO family protein